MGSRARFALVAVLAAAVCGLAPMAADASTPTNLVYEGLSVFHSSSPYLIFWTPGHETVEGGRELFR
jgi:hypothetical protein